MWSSQWSYFVTQFISRHDTSIAQLHCQSALQWLQMSQRVIDVLAMTRCHRSLGHHVALTDVNLSAVLLCHTGNILAWYKHCTIALPISAIMIIDVLVSYNVSVMTSGHRCLEHLVVPTDTNLSAVLLCHTVNISARYKHCMIALPICTNMCLGEL